MPVTQAAPDHDDDALARRTDAPVVCDPGVRLMLLDADIRAQRVCATMWGTRVDACACQVGPVEKHHVSIGKLARGQYVTCLRLPNRAARALLPCRRHGVLRHAADRWAVRPTIGVIGMSIAIELVKPLATGPSRIVSGEVDLARSVTRATGMPIVLPTEVDQGARVAENARAESG